MWQSTAVTGCCCWCRCCCGWYVADAVRQWSRQTPVRARTHQKSKAQRRYILNKLHYFLWTLLFIVIILRFFVIVSHRPNQRFAPQLTLYVGVYRVTQQSAARSSQLLVPDSPYLEHPAGREHQRHLNIIYNDFLSTSENPAFQTILSWSHYLIWHLSNCILNV